MGMTAQPESDDPSQTLQQGEAPMGAETAERSTTSTPQSIGLTGC